jgi:hypothetical protein
VPEGTTVLAHGAESARVARLSTRLALSSPARIAAALALLIGGLSMTPLRAVVTDWIGAVLGGQPAEAPSATVVGPSVFSFAVSGSTFEIRVPGAQPSGRLVVIIDDVTRGSASVIGGDGTEEIVLRAGAGRLDVLVGRSSEAEYRIVLPPQVAGVSVILQAGALVPDWRPDAELIPRTWSVRLGGR